MPALVASGRYFFADFVTGHVRSLRIVRDAITGEGAASDEFDHTADLGGSDGPGNISSFGIDAACELHLVSYSLGTIWRITYIGS